MREGILGIETDVMYQWRDLVPTYEKRLTYISDVYLKNIKVNDVKFISRINGHKEQPVKNVSLKNIVVERVEGEKVINENVENFRLKDCKVIAE